MIALTQTDIRRTFDAEILRLLPDMGLSEDAISWPNTKFAPVVDKTYLRLYLLPGQSLQATLGGDCQVLMQGAYQISIFAPKDSGVGEAERIADFLINAFPLGRRLDVCGQWLLIMQAYSGVALEDEDRYMLPVTLAYSCHAPQKQHTA